VAPAQVTAGEKIKTIIQKKGISEHKPKIWQKKQTNNGLKKIKNNLNK
jgi:hypothetical protein